MYPWPSFGGFLFKRNEHFISDTNWAKAPNYQRNRPLGSATDVATALAIGSSERTLELYLTPERFAALETMLNTRALFTDWGRPTPDSRMAFLTDISPSQDVFAFRNNKPVSRILPTKLTFISA